MDSLNSPKIEIGFSGGVNIVNVGNVDKFLSFFWVIRNSVKFSNNEEKFLITDRLYKRYIKENDLERTSQIMDFVKEQFKEIFSKDIESYNKFDGIFRAYKKSIEHVHWFNEDAGEYLPIFICISTLPYCAIDTERSLEKLDAWDGPPFWTRFYLKELYDQGKEIPELPF